MSLETQERVSDKVDVENVSETTQPFSPDRATPSFKELTSKSTESLSYLMRPFAGINETKELLQKLGTVHVVRKQMAFSDGDFEQSFIKYLEPNVRARMFLVGLASSLYGIYSLFLYQILGTKYHRSPLIFSWRTSANVLYNVSWLAVILIGLCVMFVSLRKSFLVHSVERFLQHCTIGVMLLGSLLGNLWRVSKLTGVKYFDAFPGLTDMYPDSDLIMLLGALTMHLAVAADMRFRRLLWICIASFLVYFFTVVFLQLPDFRNLLLSSQTANAPAPYLSEPGRERPIVRGLFSAAARERSVRSADGQTTITNDVPVMNGSMQNWVLALQLLMLYMIALFGKIQLELLQRRNFLELELAKKRIDVLERTINAMDTDGHKSHERLIEAQRIVEKIRLISMSTGPSGELETVLQVLREIEKTMTILEFQKEVFIGPIRTGVDYKEKEVLEWIRTADSDVHNTPIQTLARVECDLGISAKSLMKRIGVEWSLNLGELEDTLRSNRATEMNAFCLTARAILSPFLNNVLLGITPDTLDSFARTISNAYLDVPYHNAEHAASVCHHAMVLLELTGLKKKVSGIDRLALAVASLCHCVSHFGRTNRFLIDSRHELALRYNDELVLENFHSSKTFEIIRSCGITKTMSERDEKRFRTRVIQIIFSGNSDHHLSFLNELKQRLLGKSNLFEDSYLIESDKRMGLIACFKTAVYGALAMPTDVTNHWIMRLREELSHQGDDEKALGIVASFDEGSTNMALGLFELLVMPLYDEMFNLVKKNNPGPAEFAMASICSALVENHSFYAKMGNRIHAVQTFIPIPKDRTVTSSSETKSLEKTPNSPPTLVPIELPTDTRFRPFRSNLSLPSEIDDSDDENPPMLPFNAVHKL